jgi:hypothetical protein
MSKMVHDRNGFAGTALSVDNSSLNVSGMSLPSTGSHVLPDG